MIKSNKLEVLQDRALMLEKSRLFFKNRAVLEVDCPILSPYASIDPHIDLISAKIFHGKTYYLHSSPEYGMKRLLSEGIGDIFQISHVFRDGELGALHQPEFTLTEWYRLHFNFDQMIQETIDYIQLFVGIHPEIKLSYRDAFLKYTQLDPFESSTELLKNYLEDQKIDIYTPPQLEERNEWLNLVLAFCIEPQFPKEHLTILYHYPASQAALSKTETLNGHCIAKRFEIYLRGVELANGYQELTDAKQQGFRFKEANQLRLKMGKTLLPEDPLFLQALKKGLPPCCGVAVGFDRLMLLRHKAKQLETILPSSFQK